MRAKIDLTKYEFLGMSNERHTIRHLEVGTIIDGTKGCGNDMEDYVVEIVKIEQPDKYSVKVITTGKYGSHKPGDIWNLDYMKGRIHPGCNLYNDKIMWRDLI